MNNKYKSALISAVLLTASQQSSAELFFNISDTGNANANAAFLQAANNLSGIFSDDVTINIDAGFASLGAGVLGQASTAKGQVNYSAWKSAVLGDVNSSGDNVFASSLPAGNSFTVLMNGTSDNPNGSNSTTPYLDSNGSVNNSIVNISSANAKALGLLNANSSGTDIAISFSSDYGFDFDPSNGIGFGLVDFVGVAMHEIIHGLGFYSGVDIVDYYTSNGPGASSFSENDFTYVNGLDFLRHSTDSIALGADLDFTADTRAKHLSIDGGASILINNAWSTGRFNGDGSQASHWKDNSGIGALDPTAAPAGTAINFTSTDYLALDLIGWDLTSSITSSVPLPASVALLGLGMLGFNRKRKQA